MAQTLVVGGYGLIGYAIVKKLLDAGHTVRGIGRDVTQAEIQEPRAHWDSAAPWKVSQPLLMKKKWLNGSVTVTKVLASVTMVEYAEHRRCSSD